MDDKTQALIKIAITHVENHGGRVDVEEYYVRMYSGTLELGIINNINIIK